MQQKCISWAHWFLVLFAEFSLVLNVYWGKSITVNLQNNIRKNVSTAFSCHVLCSSFLVANFPPTLAVRSATQLPLPTLRYEEAQSVCMQNMGWLQRITEGDSWPIWSQWRFCLWLQWGQDFPHSKYVWGVGNGDTRITSETKIDFYILHKTTFVPFFYSEFSFLS